MNNVILKTLGPLRALAVATALSSAGWAAATPVVFSAQFDGQSDIVGVVDPTGPVVQIQTVASGSGVFGLLHYFSADQVNLGTGQGAGLNRFVADDGSELFGEFTVQLVPTADPAVLELFGEVDFTGGSGRFAGADGFATFSGSGAFISASTALSSFDFSGELRLLSEPATGALALAAALLMRVSRRRPRSAQPAQQS